MTALADLGGWPAVLRRLLDREDLDADHTRAAMASILAGEATPAQIAGFVVALRAKGETVEEMTGLVRAMLDAAERVTIDVTGVVDTCGTGGAVARRTAAFNVSTIAAFVIAGAGGRVLKHGNRGLTSTSGSFDLLEALGVTIDLGPVEVAACLERTGLGFCFAPRFHPAMRHAGPTRRELGIATIFNVLGPLANPAGVRRHILGVSDPALAERMVLVLAANGSERAMVVHGHGGLDELTTTGPSIVIDLRDGEVTTIEVDPAALGLSPVDPALLVGGDPATNADLARRIFDGERIPHRDLVVLNAAAGLVVAGLVDDIAMGLEAAAAALDDGSAAAALDRVVEVTKELGAA